MQWPVCYYLTPQSSPADIARAFQGLHDSMRTVLENIAGDNINPALAGEGLAFTTATREVPKKLLVTIADSTKAAYVRTKTDVHNKARGIEVHVDATNTDDGKFCVCNSDEPDIQRFSIDPDPSTDANPGALLRTPTGAMTLDTGVAANVLIKRNSILQQTFDGSKILGAVTYSSPGAGTDSERYGASATAAGDNTLAAGFSATASSNRSTALGASASASAAGAVAIGFSSLAGFASAIALNATVTAANQFVVGGGEDGSDHIADVYLGAGVVYSSPAAVAVNATGGSGENIAGAELALAGGKGTGTGVGGPVTVKIAPAGASSSTLNSLIEAVKVWADATGVVVNETGIDRDFRVESADNTHALFVDGGNNRVGILNSSPATALDVTGTITTTSLIASATGEVKLPDTAPGTPADRHVWMDGSSLFWRDGGTTYAVEGTPV